MNVISKDEDMIVSLRRMNSLDGLRGVLALLVCVGHLGLNTIANTIGVHVRFQLSVDIFFALSAFVLCYSNYFKRKDFGTFIIDRISRLYPLYILTVIVMSLLALIEGRPLKYIELFQEIFLVHNIGFPPATLPANFPSWSISIEMWVSIAFFWVLQRRSHRIIALILFSLIFLIFRPQFIQGDAENLLGPLNDGLVRGLVGFSTGAVAFLFYEKNRSWLRAPNSLVYALLGLLTILFMLPKWTNYTTISFYVLIGISLVALATNEEVALSAPLMKWLGDISYSIYLLHIPIYASLTVIFGEGPLRNSGKFVLVMPIIMLISYLSFRFIELPSRKFIRTHLKRRPNAPPAAA